MESKQTENLPSSGFAAAVKAGSDLTQLLPEVPGYQRMAAVPNSSKLIGLEHEKLERPRFLTASPTFNDHKAYIEYVRDFKVAATRIFHDGKGMFVAVFDYHRAGPDGAHVAAHGDHKAILILQRSPEWSAWVGSNERAMGQQDFAEFIEDHSRDMLEPDSEQMLKIATGLHATVGATFRSAINQANGSVGLQYDEQVDGKVGTTDQTIPTTFKVGLRPFMATDRYPVECRFRYRINSGRLSMHYKALHLDPITEAAVEAVVLGIGDETGVKPALGSHSAAAFNEGV